MKVLEQWWFAGDIRAALADLAARGEGPLWQPWADGATSTTGGLVSMSKAALGSACSGAASLNTVISISASPKIC